MLNRKLLTMDTPLKIGDIVMFRDRFKPKKYAIFQIIKIVDEIHIYSTCIGPKTNAFYIKGTNIYWNKEAHCENQSRSCELTYYLPVGNLLFNATIRS